MKAHVGVDLTTGLHTVVGTAGNVADVTQAHALLHGGEKVVLGDAGYQGVGKRPENEGTDGEWHTALRPVLRKAIKDDELGRIKEILELIKASARAKVEHCFTSSNACSIIARSGVVVWLKTQRSCSHCSLWPSWCWRADPSAPSPPKLGPACEKMGKETGEICVLRYLPE